MEEEETGRVRISSAAAAPLAAEDTRDLCRPDRGRNHRRPRDGEAQPASFFSGREDCAFADAAVAKASGRPDRLAFRDRSDHPGAQVRRNGQELDLAAVDRRAPKEREFAFESEREAKARPRRADVGHETDDDHSLYREEVEEDDEHHLLLLLLLPYRGEAEALNICHRQEVAGDAARARKGNAVRPVIGDVGTCAHSRVSHPASRRRRRPCSGLR